MKKGFSSWAVSGMCFLGGICWLPTNAFSWSPPDGFVDTPYLWTNNLEFDGCVGTGMSLAEGLRLDPREISLPPNAQNGNIFVRRYWAPNDSGGRTRDDIAAYLQGHWRRVITTNDWYGNSQVNALDTADLEVSTQVKIECSGQGALSKGTAIIPFDEVFANSADETKPIIVLVTPTNAACKGIAVVKTGINEQYNGETVSGFCALELNGGRSNATFNWQAIGTAKVEEKVKQ